jgi:hypothetical protein
VTQGDRDGAGRRDRLGGIWERLQKKEMTFLFLSTAQVIFPC